MKKRVVRLNAYEKGRLEWAAGYVRDHLDQPIDAETLALVADLSPYKLRAGFLQRYQQHFSEFLKAQRMKKAAALLRETNELVATVAGLCGYSNESSFYRAFKKWYGETPDGFRKED